MTIQNENTKENFNTLLNQVDNFLWTYLRGLAPASFWYGNFFNQF